ncbi:MAG: PAS domain S-box protein [Candidatus Bipolaricaulota bacterium]
MTFSAYKTRELIEYLPEALFLEDFDGKILDVNSQACELLGYSKEELLNQEVEKIVPEGKPAFLPGQIDKATRSGKPIETVNIRKDGGEIPVELRGRILEVEGKERILVSIRDITERKRRVEQLRQFKRAVEGSNDLIAASDENYTYLFANRAYSNFYQIEKEEIPGNKVKEIVGERTFKKEVRPRIDRCLQGERVEYEMVRNHPDLGKRIFKVIYYPLMSNERTHGIVAVLRDITKQKNTKKELQQANTRLKQSRERYQSYFEESGDAIFILAMGGEEHGKILEANPTAEKQTGYSRDELIGMNMLKELSAGSPVEKNLEEIDKDLSRGDTVNFTEKKKKKNGEEYWTEVVVTPLEHEGTKANLSINRNITEQVRTQQTLNEERNKLKNLHKAVEKLQHQTSEEDLLQATVDLAENMLDFGICAVSLVEEDYIVPKANSSEIDVDETKKFKRGEGITGKSIEKGETIWGEDLRDHPDAKPESKDFRAFISVPIGDMGNFQVISKEPGSFNERDVELTEILINHLREELKRVRLEEQLRQKANSIKSTKDKLESLHKVARKLGSADEKDRVFQLGVEAAVETLEFLICSFAVVTGDHFEIKATSSESPYEWLHQNMPVGQGLTGKTHRTGETYLYGDIRDLDEAKPARSEYRSIISTPIGDIGVFQVISEDVDAFSREDAQLAELLAGHVYEAYQRVELEDKLKQQAIHDPLTGLYNRRYFNETLQKEVKKSERYDKPIAFLMMDVNRFKEINDRYSHQIGDKVLCQVGNLLKKNVRDADTVVRYGGDEFLVMMPETNGGVTDIIDRLKVSLADWSKKTTLIDFPLTLAMGVSHWSPGQERNVEEALNEADRKMYEDKNR